MNDYPRVLFVTPNSFNHLTGGGITFSNLFVGWPKDRLVTVHNDHVPTSNDICESYFVLGPDEVDLIGPLRFARVLTNRRTSKSVAGEPLTTLRPAIRTGFVGRLHGNSAPQRVRLTERLERWIADYKPQLLYSILGSNAFMELTAVIQHSFSLPLVVHLMDDFPVANYRRGLFAPFERARMLRLLRHNLRAATVRMGICPEMCAAFSKRYGLRFQPFQNCVDIARWRSVVRSDSTVSATSYRLLYFGSVLANAQRSSLADVCLSVARLNAAGMPVEFVIASPDPIGAAHCDAFANHPSIRIVPPIQDDHEYFTALASADALLLPVNYDADTADYIRYSMPTKVPAYMASGTPVLVYGPRGVAQVDYAQREGWGHVVSEPDPARLDAGLRRVLTDGALRERLRVRAQALAAANHDSVKVRQRFQDILKSGARAAS